MAAMIELRICIDVPDIDRAVAFYSSLGLTVGRRFGPDWVEMLGASAPIDLLVKPAGSRATLTAAAIRDYGRHWTPIHLDVVVTDIERAVDRAREAGAVLERDIQTASWGRMANLADPFGHGVCLIEFAGRGYDELLPA
jgi:predicted enzyme related to lactoylglutathione lyase